VIHTGTYQPGDDLAAGAPLATMHTAVLLLGIDNGYEFAGGATVLLRGRRCPVLSVTAEYTVIDTSALASVAVGDVATIVGHDEADELTLDAVAALRGRSPGYWMMGFRRVPLRYRG
jgi:alanine racemase